MTELDSAPTPITNQTEKIPSNLLTNIRKLRVINYPQQEGEKAYPLFDIEIPDGWNITTYQPEFLYDLILTKNQYQIRIAEPLEGSLCEFDDSYRFGDGPAMYYKNYESIPTSFNPNLRFGKTINTSDDTNTKTSTLVLRSCSQEKNLRDNLPVYIGVTPIGVIMMTIPEEYDPKTFEEMKSILRKITLVQSESK